MVNGYRGRQHLGEQLAEPPRLRRGERRGACLGLQWIRCIRHQRDARRVIMGRHEGPRDPVGAITPACQACGLPGPEIAVLGC
jgi:hypothetical protein